MIRCICFDMDNTLYPESSYYAACYERIANMISPYDSQSIQSQMVKIRNECGDNRVFQAIIDQYDLDNKYLNEFVSIYRTCHADISLFDDVNEYLATRTLPVQYGILTNGGRETQENKVRCLGIRSFFNFILISGAFLPRHEWKPNKRCFDLVMNHTGFAPAECIYVGDSFEIDVVGALNAGMKAVLVDRKGSYERRRWRGKHYWVVSDFSQIDNVVEEIED